MENSINERIKMLIDAYRLSNNAFAKSINRTSSTINFITDGRSKPSFDVLESICDAYPEINPAWLLKGEGDMKRNPEQDAPVDRDYLADYLQKLEDQFNRLLHQLESKDQQLQTKDQQIESKDRQIEKLMDLLGKPNPGNVEPKRAPFVVLKNAS